MTVSSYEHANENQNKEQKAKCDEQSEIKANKPRHPPHSALAIRRTKKVKPTVMDVRTT